MRVLVTGGSGLIGSKYVSTLGETHDVAYTYLSRAAPTFGGGGKKLDVTDRPAVMSVVREFNPDLVIHCSALTNVDMCETNPELADKINVKGTKNIVDACKETSSKIIYISTSFVFDESKKNFTEDDPARPINYYGTTKLKGEELTANSDLPYIILRTDLPYRWSPKHIEKNNMMRLVELFEKGEKFREVVDWFNSPTLVDNFVEVSEKLIKKWEDGIYHAAGPDFINRYEFALKVCEVMGGDKNMITKIKSSDLRLPAKRPNARIVSNKIEEKTGIKMIGIDDGIGIVMKQRAKHN